MINQNLIYGIFELHKIESYINGTQTTEKEKSGMFTFTRDHRAAVVSGANEWVMAYSGAFEVKDNTLFIHAESCVKRELEGTTIVRKILKLDEENLVLEARNDALDKRSEISWKRKISL